MRRKHQDFDIEARARQAMFDYGFDPDFPEAARDQSDAIEPELASHADLSELKDLRDLLWSSIDNDDSMDLDQIEVAERLPDGAIRVLVAIADVDAYVGIYTPLDRRAERNTTSIYTGVVTYPMFPDRLSRGLTSLLPGDAHIAVVTEMEIVDDGSVRSHSIYRALVQNQAKLAYDSTGDWLDGAGQIPEAIANVNGMDAQLRLQREAADRLHAARVRSGYLDFETIEARPVVENGKIVNLAVVDKNPARSLIENLMIAANTAMSDTLRAKGLPTIQRIVREPKRWERIVDLAAREGEDLPGAPDSRALAAFLAKMKARDPLRFPDLSLSIIKLLGPGEYALLEPGERSEGHFGLAVESYTHSTAPNRRFPDVVTQRQIKAALANAPAPYSDDTLNEVAQHCTEMEDASRKLERLMRKVAAAVLFEDRIGETFEGIVTGASHQGTYVRTLQPPVEGRVIRGERGMDVGDRVRVRLLAADPVTGFIDFAGDPSPQSDRVS